MDYQDLIDRYDDEMLRLGQLRNVQAEGGPNWARYQDRITELDDHKHDVERTIPALEAADAEVAQAFRAHGMAQGDADREVAAWTRAAKILGAAGLLCLLLTLTLGGFWPTTGCVVFLAGAAGCVVYSGKVRQTRQLKADVLGEQLRAAKAQRDALWTALQRRIGELPPPTPIAEEPVPAEEEMVDAD
ncbi:hypothetical protein ABZ215_24995 [Amycolatopsis sp. NPDC006131]|uniref:hypothetical protein n=1 Tax=Amycolatopsis sp. NPDC006131 TaxID=3156731 RepID=UPI0033B5EC8E